MVEVDPMILFTAGSVAVGLAVAAICLRSSSNLTDKEVTADKSPSQAATVKPKKKQTRSAKKVAPPAEIVVLSEESEIAAIMADLGRNDVPQKQSKKAKDPPKGPSAAEVATAAAARKAADIAEAAEKKASLEEEAREEAEAEALAEKLLAMEEEKKSRKPKESPEQKAARLERVRVAKAKKVEEEELSKTAAIELGTSDSLSFAAGLDPNVKAASAPADGWAVVEDKRKLKAKAVPPVVPADPASEAAVSSEPLIPVDFVKSEITVDAKKVRVIIGTKGVTLHGIQDATGVEINTPKGDRDSAAPAIITISGTAEGVATATIAIQDICTKGYTTLLTGEDFKEGSMEVHPM
jgi:KH domain